jgi:hypothetical protein
MATQVEVGKSRQNRAGKYLTFVPANETSGLEILKVREIIGLMDITAVPRTPEFVKGIINLSEQMYLILHFGGAPCEGAPTKSALRRGAGTAQQAALSSGHQYRSLRPALAMSGRQAVSFSTCCPVFVSGPGGDRSDVFTGGGRRRPVMFDPAVTGALTGADHADHCNRQRKGWDG